MSREQRVMHAVPGWYPLLAASVSIGVANSMLFSLLSNFQDHFGFSDAGLGLIAGSGFAVGLVGQVFMAPFADRGHAKRMLLAGLITAVVGNLLLASAASMVMLVFARAVVGFSSSLFFPASRAIAIGISTVEVPKRLGTLAGVELAGFVSGPMIGGLLVGPFGFRVPFLVAGAFALGAALMLARRDLPQPPIDTERRLAFDLLRIPRIRAGILMMMALFLPVGFYEAILDRYMTDLGASDQLIGLSFLAYGIPFALLATTGGRLADRRGAMRVAVLATLVVVPLTVSYGSVNMPEMIVVLSAVEACFQAIGVPAAQSVVASGAPIGRAAAAQGLAGASNLLIGATTAFAAGALYSAVGSGWLFLIAGSGVLMCLLLAVAQLRRSTIIDMP